jgi:hypothetical protein
VAELVNLNRARKTRAKAAKAETAAQNRVRFGRTKAEKELVKAREEKAARELDQMKRD